MSEPAMRFRIAVTVNGEIRRADVEARRTLCDFLREDLALTGTHVGCEHGACGACTVIMDGKLARACLTLAVQADGRAIDTVEGLARDGRLHPVQAAFKAHHALQCGFCTPGILITVVHLLSADPNPSEARVREWLSGNLCRCTGYQFIVDAVLDAARELRESNGG